MRNFTIFVLKGGQVRSRDRMDNNNGSFHSFCSLIQELYLWIRNHKEIAFGVHYNHYVSVFEEAYISPGLLYARNMMAQNPGKQWRLSKVFLVQSWCCTSCFLQFCPMKDLFSLLSCIRQHQFCWKGVWSTFLQTNWTCCFHTKFP